MRTVEWSDKAEGQLDSWIGWLVEAAGADVAERSKREARARADSLGRFCGYRQSQRWRGYQEFSMPHLHKIIVFRVVADRVLISALYDMRQDLLRVAP